MKQKTLMKQSAYWIGVIVVGAVAGVSLQFVKAWVEPTQAPPAGNLGAPINTGATTQNKAGSLGTSGSFSAAGAVQGKTVKGTSQLCIGNDCRSSWPSGGGGGTSGWDGKGSGTSGYVTKWTGNKSIGNSNIYIKGSTVGIGTTTPTSTLHVNGSIRGTYMYSSGNIKADGTVSGDKISASTSIYSAGIIKAATTVSGKTISGTDVTGTKVTGKTVCIGTACRTTWPSGGGNATVVRGGLYGICSYTRHTAGSFCGSYIGSCRSNNPAKCSNDICNCPSGYTLVSTGTSTNSGYGGVGCISTTYFISCMAK